MRWKAHFFIGFCTCFLIFAVWLGKIAPVVVGYSMLSGFCALLPDLDMRKSKASQLLYIAALALAIFASALFYGSSLASAFGAFAATALLLFAFDLLLRPKHRQVMHTAAFGLVPFAACLALLGWEIALAFAIGYLTHLFADKMS